VLALVALVLRLASIASILLVTASCASNESGATCPSSNPPSYASFGRAFMEAYCTGCHSRQAGKRYGAPPDRNFDTEDEIRAQAAAIDVEAAAGPDARNTDMPDLTGPVDRSPSLQERELLGEFLACERRSEGAPGHGER
jgi:hypothetical protein